MRRSVRKSDPRTESKAPSHPYLLRHPHVLTYLQLNTYTLLMPESYVHAERGGPEPLGEEEAGAIAELIGALSNPTRVALLYALRRGGETTVGELAETAGITPSSASQQLRVLRHLRLVIARRDGKCVLYALHDAHVAALLDEVRYHAEHARLGWTSPFAGRSDRTSPV